MDELIASTGEILMKVQRVFKTDVDPGDDANPGDKWQQSDNTLRIRNYIGAGWLTVAQE